MEENNGNPQVENQTEQPVSAPNTGLKSDEKTMGMLCHLLAIFTGFLGPLIIWLIKKDDSPFVNDQGKEALNFQITVLIAMLISGLLSTICIGIPLAIAVTVLNLVFCIMGTVKTSGGEAYHYPYSLRLIK